MTTGKEEIRLLNRFEILGGLGAVFVGALVIYIIVKRNYRDKLPSGSIVIDIPLPETRVDAPGTRWSQTGTSIALGFASFFTILTLVFSLLDWWSFIPTFLLFNLPTWLNWAGIVCFWVVLVLGIAIMTFNVNYTPAFQRIKGKYVLATGGPYKWVRHPMYVTKMAQAVCLFLVTGLWPVLLGFVFWGLVRRQALAEEVAMGKLFGERYQVYLQNTGRFLPKVCQPK